MADLLCTIKSKNAKPEISDGKYIIRNVRDTICGIRGVCGNVLVAFTFSTNLWYWDGGFYGYLDKPAVDARYI